MDDVDGGRMTFDITLTFSTCRARLWVRAMSVAQYVIGRERAERWAVAGFYRLSRWRIGRGKWRSCEGLRS